MEPNDTQKQYNYNRVRVSKTNDLRWIANVITGICDESGLTNMEWINLLDSLEKEGGQNGN